MKVDILFLAHNRLEFTKATLRALLINTNWSKVGRFIVYDDASTDGTYAYLSEYLPLITGEYTKIPRAEFKSGVYGGPVSVMNDYLAKLDPHSSQIFAKVDSDTMLPPGWLDECLPVLENNKADVVNLLGVEAFYPVVGEHCDRGYEAAKYVGGIGLFRTGAFVTLPRPNGLFGFTAWQTNTPGVKPAWLNPSIPVCLLDRLPFEPWVSYSKEYIAKGWQRPWKNYDVEKDKKLWSWFIK